MHALITADTVGGVWTYVRELVTGLTRRGVRVTLVSFGEIPAASQVEWMNELTDFDFRPTGFQLEWMQDAAPSLELSAGYLLSIVREVKPDLLHLNQYAYGALEVDVPKLVVAHSDVVSWWVAVHGQEPAAGRWMDWYRETVIRGLAGANTVVAPSQWMLEAIARHFIRPEHAQVIYNGRAPELFQPAIAKQDFILGVGRLWDGGKQVSLLAQIDPPMQVRIAGSGEHPDPGIRTRMEFRPNTSGVLATPEKKLQLLGRMNPTALGRLYSRAAIYAATSRYEPFGLAPLEAALSRCALVMNDIPSFREIWGENACYFRHNDAASLQQVLESLAGNREERAAWADRAYTHARSHYRAEDMVNRYLDLYHSLTRAEVGAT